IARFSTACSRFKYQGWMKGSCLWHSPCFLYQYQQDKDQVRPSSLSRHVSAVDYVITNTDAPIVEAIPALACLSSRAPSQYRVRPNARRAVRTRHREGEEATCR